MAYDRKEIERQYERIRGILENFASTPKLKPNEYQCAKCKGVFEKMRPDGEALAEAKENFPGLPEEKMAIICDDCYKEIFN